MKRLMMAYTPINYNIMSLIHQDPAYKKMTSDDVLGRIMNYEMNIQEANNITKNSTRASQHPRSKILLSKQTRARRIKF
jgi:hypothetical protein